MDPILRFIDDNLSRLHSKDLFRFVDKDNWSFDWRHVLGVSSVKDQGESVSSWCFSAVDSVETASYKTTGILRTLSVQQLLDCDRHDEDCIFPCTKHSHGCIGGNSKTAFSWIMKSGLQEAETYPNRRYSGYTTIRGPPRPLDPSYFTAQINGYEVVPFCDELELAKAVTNVPVTVIIRMDSNLNGLYGSDDAIYRHHTPSIPSKDINENQIYELQSMLVVGFGMENGTPYWSLKNSYGIEWGYNGYIRMLRNYREAEGLCGIARHGCYPTN